MTTPRPTLRMAPMAIMLFLGACSDREISEAGIAAEEVATWVQSGLSSDVCHTGLLYQDASQQSDVVAGSSSDHPVDHVVTYGAWRGWGPKNGDRIVVARKGHLVLEETWFIGSKRNGEAAHSIRYENFDTGSALTQTMGGDGELEKVMIWKRDLTSDLGGYSTTSEREEIAGETCTVLTKTHKTSEGIPPSTSSACVTDDGIVLRKTRYSYDGGISDERIAQEVVRREIDTADMLPPRALFDWERWQGSGKQKAESTTHRYEVSLSRVPQENRETKPTDRITQTHVSDGFTKTTAVCSGNGLETYLVEGANANLSYIQRGNLVISRPGEHLPLSTSVPQERAQPIDRPDETILGERCSWFDTNEGMTDSSRLECRTDDDITLAIEESSWGSMTRWLATDLKKQGMRTRKVRPDPKILNWTFWGWLENDRRLP